MNGPSGMSAYNMNVICDPSELVKLLGSETFHTNSVRRIDMQNFEVDIKPKKEDKYADLFLVCVAGFSLAVTVFNVFFHSLLEIL